MISIPIHQHVELGWRISECIDNQRIPKPANVNSAIFPLENADAMGERMGRIRQISTDFFVIP